MNNNYSITSINQNGGKKEKEIIKNENKSDFYKILRNEIVVGDYLRWIKPADGKYSIGATVIKIEPITFLFMNGNITFRVNNKLEFEKKVDIQYYQLKYLHYKKLYEDTKAELEKRK